MDGGANRSMMQLMIELRDYHRVTPIVLLPKGKKRIHDNGLDAECRKNGIKYIETIIPWTRHRKVWLHRAKYIACVVFYPSLIKQLKKLNIDIVHSNGSVFELGGWISRSLRIPHVWHLREFGTEDETLMPVLGKSYYQNSFKRGDAFIAISDAIKQTFVEFIPKDKIHRIYNGISPKKYNKQAAHTNDVCQFAMVGMLTPHKNQLESIKAAAILKERGIKNFHITFMGSSTPIYLNELSSFIDANGLADYISILGLRNDVPDVLSKMDVGLMLSKSEAFGRVTIEYMFQNLAVIASNSGANPELIEDGITGLLYEFGNTPELSYKMQQIIEDRRLLKQIASNGNRYAVETFPSEKNSSAIYSLYEELLKND